MDMIEMDSSRVDVAGIVVFDACGELKKTKEC